MSSDLKTEIRKYEKRELLLTKIKFGDIIDVEKLKEENSMIYHYLAASAYASD